jgi:antitoxin component of MazEF toxin-antitoxin module
MREKIVKIGNTCYVRLSKDYRDQYNLLEKTYIEVREQPDGSLMIIPEGVQ